MSDLNIQIDGGKTHFLPGEEIKGRISWRLEPKDKMIELRLFWFTKGKGTSDVEIVEKIPFENPPQEGASDFRFALPEAPHSFSGRLISRCDIIQKLRDVMRLAKFNSLECQPCLDGFLCRLLTMKTNDAKKRSVRTKQISSSMKILVCLG
ncbi:MAG: hypothetical protein NTX50_31205 [Candidatus Sumerlaeota bacterium]|nr:hypothetical protein [Candidatus Sumerlaeota bacterium]